MNNTKIVMVACLFFDNNIGGGETLFLRMSKWVQDNGGDVYFFVKDISSFNLNYKVLFSKKNIHLLEIRRKGLKILIEDNDFNSLIKQKDKMVLGIAYQKKQYELLKTAIDAFNKKIVFYNIYWGDAFLLCGENGAFSRYVSRKYIQELVSRNEFFCMDVVSQEIVSRYTDICLPKIPVALLGNDGCSQYGYRSGDAFTILTISRLDFPFKGYIVGLIKDFAKFKSVCRDAVLKIIGDGEGMESCKETMKQYNLTDSDVLLLGSIPYEKLPDFYLNSNVYVGMGTTLLDASRLGIPAIVANSYNYSNTSPGFFHECNILGYPIEGEFSRWIDNTKACKFTFFDLMMQTFLMSSQEYENKSKEILEWYACKYSMDNMMSKFIDETTCKEKHSITSRLFRKLVQIKLILGFK